MTATTAKPLDLKIARQTGLDCACFNLRKATRLATQLYDEKLRPVGLRATQFPLLVTIRLLGPVSVNELAEELVMDRTTLTRNLKPLERDGLIESRPGSDRRVREVLLSAHGHQVLKRAHPLWQEAQEEVVRS